MKTKFKYKDKVKIIGDGFYAGVKGTVENYISSFDGMSYIVHIEPDLNYRFPEEELSLISEDNVILTRCPNCKCDVRVIRI